MEGIATASITLGVLCGIFLLALFVLALYRTLEPVARDPDRNLTVLLVCLFTIAVVKFGLLYVFPGNRFDVQCWRLWSALIAYSNPARIYDPNALPRAFHCDYPPGYLYVLWVAGSLARAAGITHLDGARILVESPALVADFLLALTVFAATQRLGQINPAFACALLFALNPGLVFDTVVWGQSDSALALPILLSALLILDSRYLLAWAMAALAVLIKPQGLILLPILAWWTVLHADWRNCAYGAAAFVGTMIVGAAPFQIGHRPDLMFSIYLSAAARYHQTSANAFNLIGLLGGLRQPDSTQILGVSAFALGMALFAGAYAIAAWVLYRRRTARTLLLSILLAYLGMFVLAPRIHERYLYPAIVLLVPLVFEAPAAISVFVAFSATFLFNLAYVLGFLQRRFLLPPDDRLAATASVVNVAGFVVTAAYAIVVSSRTGGLDARWPAAVRAFFASRRSPKDRSAAASPAEFAGKHGRPKRSAGRSRRS